MKISNFEIDKAGWESCTALKESLASNLTSNMDKDSNKVKPTTGHRKGF